MTDAFDWLPDRITFPAREQESQKSGQVFSFLKKNLKERSGESSLEMSRV
jgi:hypothetical protein